MSTVYFQYTEGIKPISPKQRKQNMINIYIQKIQDNNITIPKNVKKDSATVNFEEYLNGLDNVPIIYNDNVSTIKEWYENKFEKKFKYQLTKIGRDIKNIENYIDQKQEYNYKKNINNIAKFGIHFKLNNYDLIICSNSPDKTKMNDIKKQIQEIETITLQETNKYNLMEPKEPKLEILRDVNFDNFNKDKIRYNFYEKQKWSLNASELYEDIRPK